MYAPSWFESQFNATKPASLVTECGPATASNAVCLKTGKCLGKENARAFKPRPLFWGIQDISQYLESEGVRSIQIGKTQAHDVLKASTYSILVVYDGIHYKLVESRPPTVTVYDSLFGVYASDQRVLEDAVEPILLI